MKVTAMVLVQGKKIYFSKVQGKNRVVDSGHSGQLDKVLDNTDFFAAQAFRNIESSK